MALEGAVEFLLNRERTLLSVLAEVIRRVFGDRPSQYDGVGLLDQLYDRERHEMGFRQAKAIVWKRPGRRWAQFGSKADLLPAAAEHGVTISSKVRGWVARGSSASCGSTAPSPGRSRCTGHPKDRRPRRRRHDGSARLEADERRGQRQPGRHRRVAGTTSGIHGSASRRRRKLSVRRASTAVIIPFPYRRRGSVGSGGPHPQLD